MCLRLIHVGAKNVLAGKHNAWLSLMNLGFFMCHIYWSITVSVSYTARQVLRVPKINRELTNMIVDNRSYVLLSENRASSQIFFDFPETFQNRNRIGVVVEQWLACARKDGSAFFEIPSFQISLCCFVASKMNH